MTNNELHIEKDLFVRIANGDEAAFSIVFKKYSDVLYTHAFKILKSEFWAEETVQDVFTQVWTGRASLTGITAPPAYLFRMVANKALDRIRKQEVEIRMQYFIGRQLISGQRSIKEADDNNRLDRIDQLLLEAIDALPVQRKLVYQLKYHNDLSYQEIAEKLDITRHTVRNQLAKALHTIRTFMAGKSDFLLLLSCALDLFLKSR